MGGLHGVLANGIYRGVARLTSRMLGTSDIVQSVWAHRSIAAGEVSFGRSDIDLLMVVRQPDSENADGPELARLYEKVRFIRRFNPALGHMEVHDPRGLQSWIETDTYRGSMERRSAMLLYGQPVELPSLPVRRDDAVRRFAVWADNHFSTAVRQRNQRNLRKSVLEMWEASAVASGRFAEPSFKRQVIEAHWAASEDASLLADLARETFSAASVAFRLAGRLHARFLQPLKEHREPAVFQALLPPRFRPRVFVLLPGSESPLPPEAFLPGSFVASYELFDLYLHFVNAFAYWILPPEVAGLGFEPPSTAAFIRSCLFQGHSHTLRNPGFMNQSTWAPGAWIAMVSDALPYLREGRTPPTPPPEAITAWTADRPSCADYYRLVFPRVYQQAGELWKTLRELEE